MRRGGIDCFLRRGHIGQVDAAKFELLAGTWVGAWSTLAAEPRASEFHDDAQGRVTTITFPYMTSMP